MRVLSSKNESIWSIEACASKEKARSSFPASYQNYSL